MQTPQSFPGNSAESPRFPSKKLQVTVSFTPGAPSLQAMLFDALRAFPEITAGTASSSCDTMETKQTPFPQNEF